MLTLILLLAQPSWAARHAVPTRLPAALKTSALPRAPVLATPTAHAAGVATLRPVISASLAQPTPVSGDAPAPAAAALQAAALESAAQLAAPRGDADDNGAQSSRRAGRLWDGSEPSDLTAYAAAVGAAAPALQDHDPEGRLSAEGASAYRAAHRVLAFALADGSILEDLAVVVHAKPPEGTAREELPARHLLAAYEAKHGALEPGLREGVLKELMGRGPWLHFSQAAERGSTPALVVLKHAVGLAAGSHLAAVAGRTQGLMARYLPSFYRALLVRHEFELTAERRMHGSGGYASGLGVITLAGPLLPLKRLETLRWESLFNVKIQRRVSETLIYAHEYGHALFDSQIAAKRRGVSHDDTAWGALNEGFAVSMELMLAERMLADRAALGLSEEDADDLRLWKRARLASLRHQRSHYTEGTFRFWRQAYKRGGEEEMLRLLHALDWEKLARLDRRTLAYLLFSRDYALFADYIDGKPLGATPAAALHKHVETGLPLSPERLAEARAALKTIPAADVRRQLRTYLGLDLEPKVAGKNASWLYDALAAFFRLASLDEDFKLYARQRGGGVAV